MVKASVSGMGMAWHSFKKVLHLPGNTQRGTVLLEGRENGQPRYAAGEYGVVAAVALVGAGVALLLVGVVMVVTVSGGGTVGVLVLVGMTPCQSKSAEGGGDSTADVAFSIVCC